MTEGQLCFGCFADVAFQMHGQTPGAYQKEMKRYADGISEGMIVDCSLCGDTAKYLRNSEGKWTQTYYRGDTE